MLRTLLIGAVLGASPAYGEDDFANMAQQLGFEEITFPCSTDDGEVKVAILASGIVIYNGESRPVSAVAKTIHANRITIRHVCLYVENPKSSASKKAFQEIYSAVAQSNLGVARFTDPQFTKRVFLKFPKPPTK